MDANKMEATIKTLENMREEDRKRNEETKEKLIKEVAIQSVYLESIKDIITQQKKKVITGKQALKEIEHRLEQYEHRKSTEEEE